MRRQKQNDQGLKKTNSLLHTFGFACLFLLLIHLLHVLQPTSSTSETDETKSLPSSKLVQDIEITETNSNSPHLYIFTGVLGSGHDLVYKTFIETCQTTRNCVELNLFDDDIFHPGSMRNWKLSIKKTVTTLSNMADRLSSDVIYFVNYDLFTFPSSKSRGKDYASLYSPDIVFLSDLLFNYSSFIPQYIVIMDEVEATYTEFTTKQEDFPTLRLFDTMYKNLFAQVLVQQKSFFKLMNLNQLTLTDKYFLDEDFNDQFVFNLIIKVDEKENSNSRRKESWNLKFARTLQTELKNFFNEENSNDELLTKKENKSKFIFFAGLEGTGHHLWQDVIMKILSTRVESKTRTNLSFDCELNSLLYEPNSLCWGAKKQSPSDAIFCSTATQTFNQTLEKIQKRVAQLDKNKIYLLNLVHKDVLNQIWYGAHETNSTTLPGCGSIASFPCFPGSDKTLNKPDLLLLNEVFTSAKADFEIILLQRNSNDLVISDVIHRRFNNKHPKTYEEKVLTLNAGSLLSEIYILKKILGKTIPCITYGEFLSSDLEKIDNLLDLNSELSFEVQLEKMWRIKQRKKESVLQKAQKEYIQTLVKFNNQISLLCS
eukprot:maker-scaffold_4-snap-gene-3.5-mRNA-1 protein AED:0.01 eAED:0.01 QI:25/0.5/0.33/1/1/1/3/0/597